MIKRGMDFPISELRIVKIFLYNSERPQLPLTYMMHEAEVETFIKATVKLHHTLGNPNHLDSEGRQVVLKLDNLWEIIVLRVAVDTATYWWCSEKLCKGDTFGARLNEISDYRRVWANPKLLQLEKEDRAEEEREEYMEDINPGSVYKEGCPFD